MSGDFRIVFNGVEPPGGFWAAHGHFGQRSVTLLDASEESLENDPVTPQSLSEKLAGIVLPDSEGRPTRLGSLWAKPCVESLLAR
jgi:hypothetical protein